MTNAWCKQIPVMFGGCSDEALLMYKRKSVEIHSNSPINRRLFWAVLMKKPKDLDKVNFTKAFHEFCLDPDDKKSHELAEVLRKFYFGYTTMSKRTIYTYLMVRFCSFFVISHKAKSYESLFDLSFSCWATNCSFIRCIGPSSNGAMAATVVQCTCIASASAHTRSARKSCLRRKKCRAHAMRTMFRMCSKW